MIDLLSKKVRIIKILTFLFLSITVLSSRAQTGIPKPYTLPSPNASSLGIFGEIPISYNTGLPNINIPIYQIDGKYARVEISLSYHAEGVRPELHPGWVGAGWNLNAGGAITRVMRNINDELNAINFPNSGYYFKKSQLNTSDWSSSSKLSNYNAYYIGYDTEPDEFLFNFLGFSGKFLMNEKGEWVVQSDDNLKVEFNGVFLQTFIESSSYGNSGYGYHSRPFEKFIITDGNGTKYTFGGSDAIEYTDEIKPLDINRRGELFLATTWYLTRIESFDGSEVINFTYERGPFISQLYKSISFSSVNASNGGFLDPGCSSWSASINYDGNIVSPVYLKEISSETSGVKIEFIKSLSNELNYTAQDYSGIFRVANVDDLLILDSWDSEYLSQFTSPKYKKIQWLKLDDIYIKTFSGELRRQFNFGYNNNSNERLFLMNFTEYGPRDLTGRQFTFSYLNKNLLPKYLETITDHWGFNNGVAFPGLSNYSPSLRTPNDKVFYGIIQEITYPTGGKTVFEFEKNNYSSYISDNRSSCINETGIAGGLRIARIKNVDANGIQNTKNFYYVKNYVPGGATQSSGILNVKPRYDYSFLGKSYDGHDFRYYFSNSNPIIPLTSYSAGKHVAYSEVAEVLENGAYTIYKYTDYNTNKDDVPVNLFNAEYNPYIPFNSRPQERGKLLSCIEYDSNGFPVRGLFNTYGVVQRNISGPARSLFKKTLVQCSGSAGRQANIRVAYLNLNHSYLLTKSQNVFYKKNTSDINYTKTTDYLYQNDRVNSPTLISTSDLSGPIDKKELRYLNDVYTYTGQSTMPLYSAMNYLTSQNIINNPIEVVDYKWNSDSYNVVGSEFNEYLGFPIGSNKVYLSKKRKLELDAPVADSSFIKLKINSVQLLMDPKYKVEQENKYDNFGNLIETYNSNDIHTSLTWGKTNHRVYSQTANATSNEVYYEGFEDRPIMDGWEQYGYSNFARTGNISLRIDKPTQGEAYFFGPYLDINNALAKKYKYSCWVYSQGPSTQLFFFMKPNTDSDRYSSGWQTVDLNNTKINEWVYLEGEISVPANMKRIYLRVDNNGGGTVFFDDLRLIPSDAQMESYTYDELNGITSKTDANDITTYFEYDELGRLSSVKDFKINPLKQFYYHYKNHEITDDVFGCRVEFNSQGGSKVFGVFAIKGSLIGAPANPTRLGYDFNGWFKEPACTTPWNFETETVMNSLTLYAKWTIKSYSISATTSSGGTVTPNGITNVNFGGTVTYTITPNSGYIIKDVKVNGTSVGTPSVYTFSNVTGNQTLFVEFEQNNMVSPQSLFFEGISVAQSVNISSTSSWTITKSATWITVTPTSGSGNGTITIRASKNFSEPRNGTVTVSFGGVTKTIFIEQDSIEIIKDGLQKIE